MIQGITYARAYDQLCCDYAPGVINKTARLAFFLFSTAAFLWKTECNPNLQSTAIWFGSFMLVFGILDFLDAMLFQYVAGFPKLESGQKKSDPLTAKQVRQIQDSWIYTFLTGARWNSFYKKLDPAQKLGINVSKCSAADWEAAAKRIKEGALKPGC